MRPGGLYGGPVSTLDDLVERGLVAADWAEALAPVEGRIEAVGRFLHEEASAGRDYLPVESRVFRAFQRPLATVKVLVVGQDPYPSPDHAVGLSFSVSPGVAPPPSLVNVYRELVDDLGVAQPTTGDLTPWADQGVMLLNRVLTVQRGIRDSHRRRGWEAVTEQAVVALDRRAEQGQPVVAILWGAPARRLAGRLSSVPCLESPHPSPLSARTGFFGSKPFSRTNRLLEEQGGTPVDWRLP